MEVWEIRLKKMPFDLGYWKQWEGQRVDSAFTLERCLQGDDRGAVFETQATTAQNGSSLPATVRLVVRGRETSGESSVEDLLKRWRLAAALSHPGLIRLLAFGETRLGGESEKEEDEALHCAFVVLPQPDETLVEVLADRPLTANETRETIQPVLKALRYLESKGLSPIEFSAANVMAFGDQVKISIDNLRAAAGETERLRDGAELLRAVGQVLDQMLRGKDGSTSAIPEPFAGIIRNCAAAATAQPEGNPRWTLSTMEARLRGEEIPPPAAAAVLPNKRKPVVATEPAGSKSAESSRLQSQPQPQQPQRKQRQRRPSMLLWGAGITAALAIAVAVMNNTPPPSNSPPPGVDGSKGDPAAATSPPLPTTGDPAAAGAAGAKPESVPAAKNPASAASNKPSPTGRRPETPAAAGAPTPQPAMTSTSPEGVTQVLPEIPQKARNTITGRVRINVRVRVDGNGNVIQARQDAPMGSPYFATRALTAAQSWKFPPSGAGASQEWLIRFELSRDQTRASTAKVGQ